jgi:hypothetical protein
VILKSGFLRGEKDKGKFKEEELMANIADGGDGNGLKCANDEDDIIEALSKVVEC